MHLMLARTEGRPPDRDGVLFEQYWRRIHRIFDEEGVDNAVWVWTAPCDAG